MKLGNAVLPIAAMVTMLGAFVGCNDDAAKQNAQQKRQTTIDQEAAKAEEVATRRAVRLARDALIAKEREAGSRLSGLNSEIRMKELFIQSRKELQAKGMTTAEIEAVILHGASGSGVQEITDEEYRRLVAEVESIKNRCEWLQKQIDYIDTYGKLPPDSLVAEKN